MARSSKVGVTPMQSDCLHLNQSRYGRTDSTGDAVIERRCDDCGRTVANGRVSDDTQLAAIPRGEY